MAKQQGKDRARRRPDVSQQGVILAPGSGQVVIAPDKFKGSLTAAEVASHLAVGLRRFRADLDIRLSPVADGGDGTLDAVVAGGYDLRAAVVSGPTGQPVDSGFAVREGRAVIELADASGLQRLPAGRFAPMTATSRGTGELVSAALDDGCTTIVIGVGGSACTDGGAGLLEALGARLLDRDGQPLPPGGAALARLEALDLAGLDPRLRRTTVRLASDVDNPLLGPPAQPRSTGHRRAPRLLRWTSWTGR